MSLPVDVIFKFGGSAITDKAEFETLLPSHLEKACQHVRDCVASGLRCIVVHGAGSFGHHQAKQYGVNSGLISLEDEQEKQERLKGFCLTRQSVTKLNKYVVDYLLHSGALAVSCSPGSSSLTDNRQLVKWPAETVHGLVSQGLVPVLHGDCVLDQALGVCILSGDTVIKTLCQEFSVNQVVFLTDVSGLYDRPPNQEGCKLIRQINVSPDGSYKESVSTSVSDHDVTGGMTLKVQSAVDIVKESAGKTRVVMCHVSNNQDILSLCCSKSGQSELELTVIQMEKDSLALLLKEDK